MKTLTVTLIIFFLGFSACKNKISEQKKGLSITWTSSDIFYQNKGKYHAASISTMYRIIISNASKSTYQLRAFKESPYKSNFYFKDSVGLHILGIHLTKDDSILVLPSDSTIEEEVDSHTALMDSEDISVYLKQYNNNMTPRGDFLYNLKRPGANDSVIKIQKASTYKNTFIHENENSIID